MILQMSLLMLIGSFAYSQKIKSIDGQTISWKKLNTSELTVLLFFDPECPICQKYTKTIKQIDSIYKEKMSIYLLYPYKKLDKHLWEAFKNKYKFDYDIFLDRKRVFARKTQAKITPEVLLLDKNLLILYRGAIDNWYYDLGKNRPQASENYLIQAIDAALQGKEISLKQTKAIGCFFSSSI